MCSAFNLVSFSAAEQFVRLWMLDMVMFFGILQIGKKFLFFLVMCKHSFVVSLQEAKQHNGFSFVGSG